MGPTLRALALAAGVSPAAMSHALSGTGTLAAATRERLRAFAHQQGYVARPALAALAAYRRQRGPPQAPIVAMLGVAEVPPTYAVAAAGLGYRVRALPLAAGDDLDALALRLQRAGIVGLLISGNPDYRRCLAHSWDGLAVVAVGGVEVGTRHHTVSGRIATPLAVAWAAVRARGWSSIGAAILAHVPWHPDDDERLGAVLAAQHRWGGDVPPCLAPHGDDDAVVRWFRRHRPDAVIGFSVGVRDLLERHGWLPPFASLHLDDADHRHRDIAGLLVSGQAYAETALCQVDAAIRHRQLGALAHPLLIAPPPQWRDGASLPARRATTTRRPPSQRSPRSRPGPGAGGAGSQR